MSSSVDAGSERSRSPTSPEDDRVENDDEEDEMKRLIGERGAWFLGESRRKIHLTIQGLARFPEESKVKQYVVVQDVSGSCSEADARTLSTYIASPACTFRQLSFQGRVGKDESHQHDFAEIISQGLTSNTSLVEVTIAALGLPHGYERAESIAYNKLLQSLAFHPTIETIRFDDCELDSQVVLSIANGSTPSLKRLELTRCGLTGDDILQQAFAAIATNKDKLEILRLSDNYQLDACIVAMARALTAKQEEGSALREIHVDSCGCETQGLVELTKLLPNNNTLQQLQVGWSGYRQILPEAIFPLLNGLKCNTSLTDFRFPDSDYLSSGQVRPHGESFSMAEGLLAMNRAGRGHVKDDPDNRLKGMRVLQSAMDNLDCLYWYLKENPRVMR